LRPQRSGGCSMLRAARWCGRRALADKTRRADASTWYPGARSLANLPTPRGQPPELRLDGDLARLTILYRPRMASSPSYSPKIAAWRDLREDFARGAWRVDRVGG
jgi:hypothetical protein